MAIELELIQHLEEEDADTLINQFACAADYDGEGNHGTKFIFLPLAEQKRNSNE